MQYYIKLTYLSEESPPNEKLFPLPGRLSDRVLRDCVGIISLSMSRSRSVVEKELLSRLLNSDEICMRKTILARTGATYLTIL